MTCEDSLLHKWCAARDAGDLEALDRYLHVDVTGHAPGGVETTDLEQERETWRLVKAAMPGIRHKIQEVVSMGSTIAARIVVTGTLRGKFAGISADGRSFRVDQAVFAHTRDGKVSEFWAILDTGHFLQQMGAIPGGLAEPPSA